MLAIQRLFAKHFVYTSNYTLNLFLVNLCTLLFTCTPNPLLRDPEPSVVYKIIHRYEFHSHLNNRVLSLTHHYLNIYSRIYLFPYIGG